MRPAAARRSAARAAPARRASAGAGAHVAEATTADPTEDSGRQLSLRTARRRAAAASCATTTCRAPTSHAASAARAVPPRAERDLRGDRGAATARRSAKALKDATCWAVAATSCSRVLSNGNVFEKAGCSLSVVYGTMPQEALASATTRGADRAAGYAPGERVPFFACGLSSVMHPRNPMAPTMHFNYRYFETDGGVWWFGGGSAVRVQAVVPLRGGRQALPRHVQGGVRQARRRVLPALQEVGDEYFYIKHRGETRRPRRHLL